MNKPRLIDANKLIEDILAIHYNCTGMRAGKTVLSEFAKQYRDDILKTIEDQPTTYDIDKVIRELIDNTQECTDRIRYETHSFVPLFDAIKIVKGENNE